MTACARGFVCALLTATVVAAPAQAAPLIVNEFNAVSANGYLNGDTCEARHGVGASPPRYSSCRGQSPAETVSTHFEETQP